MTFVRRLIQIDTDATTVLGIVSDLNLTDPRAVKAWFELLRIGGCGAGEIELKDRYTLRGGVEVGQYFAFEYTYGERWYLGRVESVAYESPMGVRISLYGRWGELSEVFPGGFRDANVGQPHRYARSDFFDFDPDHAGQTWDQVSEPQEVVPLLFSQYINPALSNVSLGPVEGVTPPVTLEGFVVRGEESAAQLLTMLATMAKSASVGMDQEGRLFFMQRRTAVLATVQEGSDLESVHEITDRSLLFNRMLMTGGYVYLGQNFGAGTVGYYRYRAEWKQFSSISDHGERSLKVFTPWIVHDDDGLQFAKEFFRIYAVPTTRYDLKSGCRAALLKPWDGQITLKDASGATILTSVFGRVRVLFDHCPIFEITLGPEEPQFPTPWDREPQRWEPPKNEPHNPVPSLPSFSGTFLSSSSLTTTHTLFTACEGSCDYIWLEDDANPSPSAGHWVRILPARGGTECLTSGCCCWEADLPPNGEYFGQVHRVACIPCETSSQPPSSAFPVTSDADCGCPEGVPVEWLLTASGFGNGTCDKCNEFNGTFTLKYIPTSLCGWRSDEDIVLCGACLGATSKRWTLGLTGGLWRLDAVLRLPPTCPASQFIQYTIDPADFDCLGTNVLTAGGNGSGMCSVPATVTIAPG